MPGIFEVLLDMLTHFILTAPYVIGLLLSHFTDEDTESQKKQLMKFKFK